jgi:hypothetical protein
MRTTISGIAHPGRITIGLLGGLLALACGSAGDEDILDPNNPNGPGGPGSSGSTTPEAPKDCRSNQVKHIGLGGKDLNLRVDGSQDQASWAPIIEDRHRMKPYEVLKGDFARTLGTAGQTNMTNLINNSADAFGAAPARWYAEPQASAVSLYTTYRVAFRGCLQYSTTMPTWSTQPTAATAATECAALQQKAWDRVPVKEEIDACVAIATDEASFAKGTPQPVTDAKTKWAYACASVLSSSNFTSY